MKRGGKGGGSGVKGMGVDEGFLSCSWIETPASRVLNFEVLSYSRRRRLASSGEVRLRGLMAWRRRVRRLYCSIMRKVT